ncbi:MAG: dual specificity protein phosphatase family protein [Caldilineaceae bacterium]|nr:dual specificity protein phosphatase family protein [Caldilineaceae bacterium]
MPASPPLRQDPAPSQDPTASLHRPHENCYWILPGRLMAGEYPGAYHAAVARARLQAHLDAGITYFLDLTHPADGLTPYAEILQEQMAYTRGQVRYQRRSIPDMSVPSRQQMVEILDTIDAALAQNQVVYLHCWGGIGRTGTVVGCYLVRHGLTGEAALAQLDAWWQTVEKVVRSPRSPETDAQVAMILGWQELGG